MRGLVGLGVGLRAVRLSLAGVLALAAGVVGPGVALGQAGPDIFVTPVANAPFHGVVVVERTELGAGGAVVPMRTIREIGRDNQGRIHNEARRLEAASDRRTPQLVRIHLYDPVSRTTAYVYPQRRTFTTGVVGHPPSTEPPDAYASPAGAGMPLSQFAREEDLGVREMEGLTAHGVRITQTIPAESSGAGKEIAIVDEYWYSAELHMNLAVRHDDPRTGSVAMTVTGVSREEPEAAFFEIPADYRPGMGQ